MTEPEARAAELKEELERYNKAYYQDDEPLVGDDVYDARLDELGAQRHDAVAISAAMIGIVAGRAVAAGRATASTEPLYLRSPDVTLPHGPKRVTA